MTPTQLIEKMAEILPELKPNSTRRAERLLRIVLRAIEDGEIVDGYEYSFGLKPDFAKFMEEVK